MYCDDMELSEGQSAAWCKIRSVLNPKSAPYNYPTLISRDECGIKTRSVTTTEKLETFASQLEGVFTNEIDAELDQPIARARLHFQKVIPFDPDIHPDRIRFGDSGRLTQGKHVARTTSPTKSYAISFLRCVFHGYRPRARKRAWALMAHKPSKRRSDQCSYRLISLPCC